MSQNVKCEFTHKRGVKIITHIFFIQPDLLRDRAFFIYPHLNKEILGSPPSCQAKNFFIPMNAIGPHAKETVAIMTMCKEKPRFQTPTSYHKSSIVSRLLNKKWRFGGGIIPSDKYFIYRAPQKMRGFFFTHEFIVLSPFILITIPIEPQ